MALWDLNDEYAAEAVAEVQAESGHTYQNGSWRGWEDRAGRRSANMRVPEWKQNELDSRVAERVMAKRRQREDELAAQHAQAQAALEEQQAFADELVAGGSGRRKGEPWPLRYPAGHPRAGQFRPWSEAGDDPFEDLGGEEAGAGGGGGGGGRRWGRSPHSPYSVPRYAANLLSSVLGAGAGIATVGMGMVLSPLGGTGAGATQVGQAVVGLLTSSVNAVAAAGSSVLSLAIGGLLAGAIGGAAAMVLSAVGDLFGQIAQAITSALQGVVTVVKDVFRDAGQYAQAAMQMVYMGGYGLGDATGAISTFGALGMSPEATSGMLGQWSMRPEFLAMRLGPLGGMQTGQDGSIDWAGTLRGMRGAMGGYAPMAQWQVLQALLGPGAAGQLMPMMMMEEGAFEQAMGNAEGLRAPTEQLRALREELAPAQAQVGLLAQVIKVELASAALEPVLVLLQSFLDLVTENRGAIHQWMAELPSRLAEWMIEATEWAERLHDALPGIAERLRDVVDGLRSAWGVIRDIGEFVAAHPTLSAVFAGAALGGMTGGVPGAVMGGALLGGTQVGAQGFGVGGGVGGGLLGMLGGAALMRYGGAGLTAARAGIGGLLMGSGSLAFPVAAGGSLAEGGALAGGGLLAGTGGIVALVAGILAASTAIAAWTSGWWGAYREQKEAERQAAAMEGGARELGYVTPEMAAESIGPNILKGYKENTLSQKEQAAVAERMYEMMEERRKRLNAEEGEEGEGGSIWSTLRERLSAIADNTRPDRTQQAHRQALEEASGRSLGTLEVRLDPRFEAMFELELVQANWRGLQVAIGG